MMALAGVELETFVSEPDALTTRPKFDQPLCFYLLILVLHLYRFLETKNCKTR